MIEDRKMKTPFVYSPVDDVIKYNLEAEHATDYDMDYVISHELSHRMDELEYHSWENSNFLGAIDICRNRVYANKEQVQSWFAPEGKYERDFAVSDIINALTEGNVTTFVGHEPSYWTESERYKPMEIFADLSSLDIQNHVDKEIKEMLKELFSEYVRMVS